MIYNNYIERKRLSNMNPSKPGDPDELVVPAPPVKPAVLLFNNTNIM